MDRSVKIDFESIGKSRLVEIADTFHNMKDALPFRQPGKENELYFSFTLKRLEGDIAERFEIIGPDRVVKAYFRPETGNPIGFYHDFLQTSERRGLISPIFYEQRHISTNHKIIEIFAKTEPVYKRYELICRCIRCRNNHMVYTAKKEHV